MIVLGAAGPIQFVRARADNFLSADYACPFEKRYKSER
jgi:hypothetical protein